LIVFNEEVNTRVIKWGDKHLCRRTHLIADVDWSLLKCRWYIVRELPII
jgi:hypothetical protein